MKIIRHLLPEVPPQVFHLNRCSIPSKNILHWSIHFATFKLLSPINVPLRVSSSPHSLSGLRATGIVLHLISVEMRLMYISWCPALMWISSSMLQTGKVSRREPTISSSSFFHSSLFCSSSALPASSFTYFVFFLSHVLFLIYLFGSFLYI